MSLFCQLGESDEPVRWAEDVQGLYQDGKVPGYITNLASPMRNTYKTQEMRDQDMLKTKVRSYPCTEFDNNC